MFNAHAGGDAADRAGGDSFQLVQVRVVGVLAIMFVIAVILAGPLGGIAAPMSALGTLRVVGLTIGLPLLMAAMARLILEPAGELSASRDELRQLYDRARLDALLDPLTGLGNYRAFQEEIARQISESRRYGRPVSLVLMDVDDLKRVNDDRGHAAGNELLASMGRLISVSVRGADRAFRIGGDEFALLMPHTDAVEAHAMARRLLASSVGGHPGLAGLSSFSFSAGISTFPAPGSDASRLHRQADAALYWAKRHGRTDVQVFDSQRHGTAGDTRSTPELAAAVADVAARRALQPVYQPIFSLESGQPIGFEGLVRPARDSGFTTAEALFAAAEVSERTVELDMACLEVVAAGVGALEVGQYVSFNLSPRTLETEQFRPAELLGLFRRSGLAPSQVVLELTEREAVEDMPRLRDNLAACRATGMRIAADDVGAGNAGLRLLSEIRFDIVKIDLSLVQGGVLRDSALAVLRVLCDVADRSGAIVVAEGVETPEQLATVRALGLASGQGYLLARPDKTTSAGPLDLDALAIREDPRIIAFPVATSA